MKEESKESYLCLNFVFNCLGMLKCQEPREKMTAFFSVFHAFFKFIIREIVTRCIQMCFVYSWKVI